MRHTPGQTHLSVAELVELTGMPRSTVVRVRDAEALNEAFGWSRSHKAAAITHAAVWIAYGERRENPSCRLSALSDLANVYGVDAVHAVLLGEAIPETELQPATGQYDRLTVMVGNEGGQQTMMRAGDLMALLVDVQVEAARKLLPPPDDELLLADEVRQILRGSIPKALRPVLKNPHRWKKSDVRRYLQLL